MIMLLTAAYSRGEEHLDIFDIAFFVNQKSYLCIEIYKYYRIEIRNDFIPMLNADGNIISYREDSEGEYQPQYSYC